MNYYELKENIGNADYAEFSTEISLITESPSEYCVNDERLPHVLHFSRFERKEAKETEDFLNDHRLTNITARRILQIWFKTNDTTNLREYLESHLNELNHVWIELKFNGCMITIKIHYRAEVYMSEIMDLLGLFPNEFDFMKQNRTISVLIKMNRVEENDKVLRMVENL